MTTLSDEKQPCERCGAMILPLTAQANGGLCAPCKMGRRQTIDDARLRHQEQQSRPPDPFQVFWRDLVDRASGRFEQLSQAEQLFYATSLLSGEIYNGGLHQYFFNSAGSRFAEARAGLETLGAERCLGLLDAAAALLFPQGAPAADWGLRREALPWWTDDEDRDAAWTVPLDRLDKAFSPLLDHLNFRLAEFAIRQNLVQVPNGYMDEFRALIGAPPEML
jgi:hypothetical protein